MRRGAFDPGPRDREGHQGHAGRDLARARFTSTPTASLTDQLERITRAGLDSIRVSLNSANSELYEAYYLPQGYGLTDVERSLRLARRKGLYVALNLLTFPGITDREGEVDALVALVVRHRVDQLQTRPLAIDPRQYVEVADGRGAGGMPLGLKEMLQRIRKTAPWLVIGNFSRARGERRLRVRLTRRLWRSIRWPRRRRGFREISPGSRAASPWRAARAGALARARPRSARRGP